MRTKGLILCIMIACFLLSGCGLGEKESAAPGQETSPETGTLSPAKAEDYPFDRLGVMLSETRLGPLSEEGRVISEAEFQSLPEENEIRLRYVNGKGEAGAIYSFIFQESDSIAKDVYPLNVVLMDQGNLYVSDGMHYGGDRSYLYQYSAGLAYRLLTLEERASLGAPMAYIKGCDNREERMGQQDLYALTEDGYVVAGAWDGKAYWSDWAALGNQELYISREPLPEMVRLHLVALGMRYLLDSDAPVEPLAFREWVASLEAEGQMKEMTGAEALSLALLLGYPHPDREAEAEAWGQHLSEVMARPEGALKFTVSDGSGQPYRADGTAGETALYISPQGVLAAEMPGLKISPAGGEACFQIRGKVYARLKDQADPALYEQLKAWNPGDLAPWAQYPFDRLGVMAGEGRLGPATENGEEIKEEYQTPPEVDQVVVSHFVYEPELSSTCWRYSFGESGTPQEHPCHFTGTLYNSHYGYCYTSGPISGAGDYAYLYQTITCRKYRPLEADESPLQETPAACFRMSRADSRETDVFALTREGYLLHGLEVLEEDVTYDSISREALREEKQLHLMALVVRYLDAHEFVSIPFPFDSVTPPEEYWLVEVEYQGEIRQLSGQDVKVLGKLSRSGRFEEFFSDDAMYSSGRDLSQEKDLVKISVRDSRQESSGNRYPALYLNRDGQMLVESFGLYISSLDREGYRIDALLTAELTRKLSPEVYEFFIDLAQGALVEREEKSIPLSAAEIEKAGRDARDVEKMLSLNQDGELAEKAYKAEDFDIVYGKGQGFPGQLILLNRADKELIIVGPLNSREQPQTGTVSLDFCQDPRLILAAAEDEIYILDREAVYVYGAGFSDRLLSWKHYSLPEGMSGDEVEDMLISRSAKEKELVLVTKEKGNFGLPLEEAGESGFVPTENGYHWVQTDKGPAIRAGVVTWLLPKTPREIRIISATEVALTLGLIDRERKEASFRVYADYRDAPWGKVVAHVSEIDFSDWAYVPQRFMRANHYGSNPVLMPREKELALCMLSIGFENITPPEKDPLLLALEEAAGAKAPEVDEQTLQNLNTWFGEAMPGRFLLSEYEDPRDVDMRWLLADVWVDETGPFAGLSFVEDQTEWEKVNEQLKLGLRKGETLIRYESSALEALLQRYLGLGLSDMHSEPPGGYAEEYDAWYMQSPGSTIIPWHILAGRVLADGSLLLVYEDGYGGRPGLVQLKPVGEGWQFIGNRFLGEEDNPE